VFWDLGTFGGARSWTHAINDRGQAVGFSMTADGVSHAFSWERGRIQDLGTFGGLYAEAVDIDDNGQILVVVQDSDSRFYPLLINSRGVATRPFTMAGNQIPRAMNNRGDFVGTLIEQGGSAYRGFVYYDHTLLLLDQMPAVVASGLRDVQPTAINDRGWIAGRGIDASSQYRAFLLVPSR
jgi:probable HAF family extracellular repeat protein